MRGCLFLLIALACLAAPAQAQNHVYSSPGSYTLPADSTSTGMFNIKIMASNVTLDLGGHTVRCDPAAPGIATTFGVYAPSLSNVTIKNGSITGCFMGVHASSSTNSRIENVDFTGNTYIGVNNAYGTGAVVTGSTFVNISGYDNEAYAVGINGVGSDATIIGNTCSNLHRQPGAATEKSGEGVCILVSAGSTDFVIEDNEAINSTIEADIGIWIGTDSSGGRVGNNTIAGFPQAIRASGTAEIIAVGNDLSLASTFAGSFGIRSQTGFAIGNTITGFETAVEGDIIACGNGGG